MKPFTHGVGMAQARAKIRLHVAADLGPGAEVVLDREQAHYLFGVMRQTVGAGVMIFNGRDGEWLSEVSEAGKRAGRLVCREQVRAQSLPPDLWLCFAPIKKARTDFIAEKACEMGCRRILPVLTRNTNAERVNVERLQAHAVEAAEQCGLLSVPKVAIPVKLDRMLSDWPQGRQLMFCDERLAGVAPTVHQPPQGGEGCTLRGAAPWAVLIGPEGGFTVEEAERLRGLDYSRPVALGPRVLRADTAAVAALAYWQMTYGDWT
ncbi:MAG: 16S rRNA (uracil(1498)-N(3))-methyltransferase [Pseudomonadota bacterium]